MSHSMRFVFSIAMLLSAALFPGPANADRALVIGINDYPIKPLAGSVRDAENIRTFLIDTLKYDAKDVRLLRNSEAGRAAILGSIQEWLVNGTQPGERVFFYYSGHGSQQPASGPDAEADANGRMYDQTIVPADMKVAQDGRITGMISDKELKAAFAPLKGRRATAVFDSCHSGTVTRSMGGASTHTRTLADVDTFLRSRRNAPTRALLDQRGKPTMLDRRDDLTVWSAVTSYQLALEDVLTPERQGVFTGRFVRGIRERKADTNGDGRITHVELLDWLQIESRRYCDNEKIQCEGGLLPTLEVAKHLQAQSIETTLLHGVPTALPVAQESETLLSPAASPLPGTVQLRFLSGPNFHLGDKMQVSVHSSVDGYLTLFDIDAGGVVTQIFPNPYSAKAAAQLAGGALKPGGERRIYKNETLTIPVQASHGFEWTAGEPLGEGRFVAVLTVQPVNFDEVASAGRGAEPIKTQSEAHDYVQTIAALLRAPWTGDLTDTTAGWSVASATYTIAQ